MDAVIGANKAGEMGTVFGEKLGSNRDTKLWD